MSTDTLAQASAPAHGLAIECLCPFCGALNRGSVGRPCPQCGTEDTTAARAAALRSQRVGPWFVLAPRNPAAPGVSFPALLGMIRQGTVSERNVVRGPATGQLWRLAGKVRGLSPRVRPVLRLRRRADGAGPRLPPLPTAPVPAGRR